jgi:hypothetical protein
MAPEYAIGDYNVGIMIEDWDSVSGHDFRYMLAALLP